VAVSGDARAGRDERAVVDDSRGSGGGRCYTEREERQRKQTECSVSEQRQQQQRQRRVPSSIATPPVAPSLSFVLHLLLVVLLRSSSARPLSAPLGLVAARLASPLQRCAGCWPNGCLRVLGKTTKEKPTDTNGNNSNNNSNNSSCNKESSSSSNKQQEQARRREQRQKGKRSAVHVIVDPFWRIPIAISDVLRCEY